MYTMEYYLVIKKKKGLPFVTVCMHGPGEYYAKLNKPIKERQVLYDFTHMWNLMNRLT